MAGIDLVGEVEARWLVLWILGHMTDVPRMMLG